MLYKKGKNIIKNKYVYVFVIVVALAFVFGILRWNDYREKELVDVLEADKIVAIQYEMDDVYILDSVIDEKSIQELLEFFSQYKVKKEGPRNFTTKFPDEQFSFTFEYEDERITLPTLFERDVVLIEYDQYKITNGPIDYKWIENFMKENKYSE